MNPPDSFILRFLYWLVNTPGLGGAAVAAIVLTCLGSFLLALRWIATGRDADDRSSYAYPTSTLLHHREPRTNLR